MSDYFKKLQDQAVKEAVEKAVQEAVEKTQEATRKATQKEDKENFAIQLLKLGENTLEGIAKATGLTLRRVRVLAKTVGD